MPLSDHQPVRHKVFCSVCSAEVVPLPTAETVLAVALVSLVLDTAKRPMICPHCKATDSLRAA